ncbi:hypothetical protein D3C87_1007090 [compost metagenome]
MNTGVGIILIGLASMFISWLIFGKKECETRRDKFIFWLKSTLVATVVLMIWLLHCNPDFGVYYAALISFCCGGFMNLCRSYVGLMIP